MKKKIQWFVVFSCCLLLVGLVFSPFILSGSMWFLVAAGLWQVADTQRTWQPKLVLRRAFEQFFRQKNLLVLSLLLLVPVLSGLWSSDIGYWLERVRVRLPFFVLPFAFANLPRLEKAQHRTILYFFLALLVLTSTVVLINFYLNFDVSMQALREGRAVWVPRGNHIRYSLLVAIGVPIAGWLAFQEKTWQRGGLITAAFFLFVFLHIQSVRSGLVAVYVVMIFSILKLIFVDKKVWAGIISLLFLATMLILGSRWVPSLSQKISYMTWDWGQTEGASGGNYSDSARKISLLAGWELVKFAPILGVGAGDLPREMSRITAQKFPQYTHDTKLPHNQWLYWWVGTGLLGCLLSCWAVYRPIFKSKPLRNFYLFAVFQGVIFTSFLAEYTLETAVGVGFFLFFQLLFIKLQAEFF